MTESARAEVDINLRIAALRSSEFGIYFKSLWRLPIARHAAGRRVGGAAGGGLRWFLARSPTAGPLALGPKAVFLPGRVCRRPSLFLQLQIYC